MGLLDQVVGALANGQSAQGNPLLDIVMQLVNNPQTGGLAGLVAKLQQGGIGDIVNSWVSTGQNLPVSGEQLQSALGGDMLGQIAAQLGVSPQQASGRLADLLPQIIDQLTADDWLPQDEPGDLLTQGLDLLKKGGLFG